MKTSSSSHFVLIMSLLTLLFVGCNSSGTTTGQEQPTTDALEIIEPLEEGEVGSWVPDTEGPWDGSIKLATSEDGITFEGDTVLFANAGVPNLLQRENGDLVLVFQYFSLTDESLFDVIAYSISEDEGKTWSDLSAVAWDNLPEPIEATKVPMDPTLVETEDGGLRLYFTYHEEGNKRPALYSAFSADGSMDSSFVVDPEPALMIDGNLLDPAVVYFDGQWHHYTWQDTSDENIHSVSEDGVTFTRQDNITLPMDFLGQVIPFDGGLKFYGTGNGGVATAVSLDGATWTMDTKPAIQRAADPGVQQLADGTYVMVYTSMNFNQ